MPMGNPLIQTIKELMIDEFMENKWFHVPGNSWGGAAAASSFFEARTESDTAPASIGLSTAFPTVSAGSLAFLWATFVWESGTYSGTGNRLIFGNTLLVNNTTYVITIDGNATGLTYTPAAELEVQAMIKAGSWGKWYLNGSLVFQDAGIAPSSVVLWKTNSTANKIARARRTQLFFGTP